MSGPAGRNQASDGMARDRDGRRSWEVGLTRGLWISAVVVAAIVVVARFTGTGSTDGSSPSSSTVPTAVKSIPGVVKTIEVVKTSDISYATKTPAGDWNKPLLDVYAPARAKDLPMVVILPNDPSVLTKDGLTAYRLLAEEIAQEGAVAVVANWGQASPLPWTVQRAQESASLMGRGRDSVACAVSFAAAHATQFGADPSRLVLLGHGASANVASMAALGRSSPFPGCSAKPGGWRPKGLLLWDGDWLTEASVWDRFGATIPTVMAAYTPWKLLDTAPVMPVEFAVDDNSITILRRCEHEGNWLALRDPSGELAGRLEGLGTLAGPGALADGCIDLREGAEVMAAAMAQHGFPVQVFALTESSSTDLSLGDLSLTAKHALALARR